MRPTYSPTRPTAKIRIPMKTNRIAKSVNSPSLSGPRTIRRAKR